MKINNGRTAGKTNKSGSCLSLIVGVVIVGAIIDPRVLMALIFVGGLIGACLLIFRSGAFSSGNPDKVTIHRKNIFGDRITEVYDTKNGDRNTHISKRNFLSQRQTYVFQTKQCRKCGGSVQRNPDGCFYCCGRSFR